MVIQSCDTIQIDSVGDEIIGEVYVSEEGTLTIIVDNPDDLPQREICIPLDIVLNLLDNDSIRNGNTDLDGNTLDAVLGLLMETRTLLSPRRYDIFRQCIDIYDNDSDIFNEFDLRYADWLKIADEIGDQGDRRQSCPRPYV